MAYPNVYRQIRGNFGSPLFATATTYQNAFVQDAWKINKYLKAKLGVRWERRTRPMR